MTKILISGVAGFIGSHTLEHWKGKRDKIWGIDDFSSGKPENLDGFIDRMEILYQESIAERAKVFTIFNAIKPDVVLHLAAQPSLLTSIELPLRDANTNIFGTLNLLEAAKHFDVKHFVFASTSAVSEWDRHEPEMDMRFDYLPQSPYGISKLCAEMYVRWAFPRAHTILRYANIYGPRQVPLGENQLIPRAIKHILYGDDFEIYGDGKQKRDFTFVRDVAKANYLACIKRGVGTNYVATGESVSVLDVLDMVAEELGFQDGWKHGEKRDDRAALWITRYQFPQIGNIDTPLREGIKQTIDWWKKQDG